MSTIVTAPVHRTDINPADAAAWSCRCGEGGSAGPGESTADLARAHVRFAVRTLLRSMDADQVAAALRESYRSDERPTRTAALELVIVHDTWLHHFGFRTYLDGEWDDDDRFQATVLWSEVASGLGLVEDAEQSLRQAEAPAVVLDELVTWAENRTTDKWLLDGTDDELAVLRIATSIAAELPVRLGHDADRLGTRSRGLVLTALGHLLSHGGATQFRAAPSWTADGRDG